MMLDDIKMPKRHIAVLYESPYLKSSTHTQECAPAQRLG